MAFTAANRVVIGSGPDDAEGGLSVVDPTTGTTELVIDGLGRPFAVNPAGTLVAGRRGDAVVIVDLATGEDVRLLRTRSLPRAIAFAPEGQLLATAGSDRSIEVWETVTGARRELLAGHSAPATHLAFRADGATLLSGSDDGAVIAWDLTGDRRVVRQLATPAPVPRTDRLVFRVTPSPDLGTAAYLYGDQVGPDDFALRDLRTGEFRLVQSTGHPNEAFQSWTPDGRHLVTVGSDSVARLWDSGTGSLTAERTVSISIDASSEFSRAETIGSVGWHSGGNSVFLGLHAGGVAELDADTLDVVETLRFSGSARNVDVSPDGRLLAVGLADLGRDEGFRVELVDRVSGDTVATFEGVDAQWSLEFSPDGALLAAGGDDGLITLIDPRERTVLGAPLRGVDGPVVTLTFSSDGRQFVTNSFDGTVELWDVADRGRVARLTPGEPGYAAFAWFGEGDTTVVVADERDGLWSISSDPDEWERRACEMAGRNLTEAEWSQTVPEREYRTTCPDNPS